MSKKSALEQALLEGDEIVNEVKKNAKDMLFSQMKPELERTIRESFAAEDDDETIEDNIEDTDTDPLAGDVETSDADEVPVADDSLSGEIADEVPAIDSEISVGDDSGEASEFGVEDEFGTEDEFGDEDEMDLTGASDADVIKVFKKLGDDAEIEIVKDGNNISINAGGEEYIVKLNEEEEKDAFLESLDSLEEDEIIYEIVMDDDEEDFPEASPMEEDTLDEVARTHSDGRKMERKPEGFFKYASSRVRPAVNENTVNEKTLISEASELKNANAGLITENTSLKADLTQHKDALRILKENLEKVALFNTNLANVNRLFCEHATTMGEKKSVIDRFDSVESIKESKSLFKIISTELKGKTEGLTESIESKITKTVSSTGLPLLQESAQHVVETEGLARIKQLIAYVNKKGN